jgi:Mlc titration factor MtfA (ptsG expression regulator)
VVRLRRRGLPPDGPALIEQHLAVWPLLDDSEQQRLLQIADELLSRKRWEAARGFELTDTVRVVIAAQAALLVLGLSADHYRLVSAIIVHPSTMQTSGVRAGPSPGTVTADPLAVLGLAQDGRGPVVLAWDQAIAGAHRSQPGNNVVLHEIAHKLDMLEGAADGVPRLPRTIARREWIDTMQPAYDRLVRDVERGRDTYIDPYAAESADEYFAVVSELHFSDPEGLARTVPSVASLLARFYGG